MIILTILGLRKKAKLIMDLLENFEKLNNSLTNLLEEIKSLSSNIKIFKKKIEN
jgi:hypothetical protein